MKWNLIKLKTLKSFFWYVFLKQNLKFVFLLQILHSLWGKYENVDYHKKEIMGKNSYFWECY